MRNGLRAGARARAAVDSLSIGRRSCFTVVSLAFDGSVDGAAAHRAAAQDDAATATAAVLGVAAFARRDALLELLDAEALARGRLGLRVRARDVARLLRIHRVLLVRAGSVTAAADGHAADGRAVLGALAAFLRGDPLLEPVDAEAIPRRGRAGLRARVLLRAILFRIHDFPFSGWWDGSVGRN